jgi:DNA (cytosine-5)-methyltransferase 1
VSRHYWNEHDQHAAAWLTALIDAGELPPGDVDTRSIKDVTADDLRGYVQCHFFAGIGGWSLALRLAGWPNDRPCWTGSCPCQPFSNAGQQKAQADERHLWPDFFRLIRQCRPDVVFGEQVESAIRHGWLDGIQADLEGEDYAVGHCVLGAHSVGAPHIRQRLYWMADAGHSRREYAAERQGREDADGLCGMADAGCQQARRHTRSKVCRCESGKNEVERQREKDSDDSRCGPACRLAFPNGRITGNRGLQRSGEHGQQPEDGVAGAGLEHTASNGRGERRAEPNGGGIASGCSIGGLVNTDSSGLREHRRPVTVRPELTPAECAGSLGFWSDYILIPCRDGKTRRLEPGLKPLVDGVPGRVGLLRGYCNAIVPQTAAAFVQAFLETKGEGGGW